MFINLSNFHLNEDEKINLHKIYELYYGLMLKVAKDITVNQSTAEDAVSDAFVKICKYSHKINDIESNEMKNYFAKIVKNCAKNIIKKQK